MRFPSYGLLKSIAQYHNFMPNVAFVIFMTLDADNFSQEKGIRPKFEVCDVSWPHTHNLVSDQQ